MGRVIAPHGARGGLKVEALSPAGVLSRGNTVSIRSNDYEIESSRKGGRFVYLMLHGITSREQAQSLRGEYLEALEDALEVLPPDSYYRYQLIGLTVLSSDGRDLGRIVDVLSALENDVYVVKGQYGEVLLPAVDDVVREVDLHAGQVIIDIIPGLLP